MPGSDSAPVLRRSVRIIAEVRIRREPGRVQRPSVITPGRQIRTPINPVTGPICGRLASGGSDGIGKDDGVGGVETGNANRETDELPGRLSSRIAEELEIVTEAEISVVPPFGNFRTRKRTVIHKLGVVFRRVGSGSIEGVESGLRAQCHEPPRSELRPVSDLGEIPGI